MAKCGMFNYAWNSQVIRLSYFLALKITMVIKALEIKYTKLQG